MSSNQVDAHPYDGVVDDPRANRFRPQKMRTKARSQFNFLIARGRLVGGLFHSAGTFAPYVEIHHIVPLTDDGEDTIDNMACLRAIIARCTWGLRVTAINLRPRHMVAGNKALTEVLEELDDARAGEPLLSIAVILTGIASCLTGFHNFFDAIL